MKKYNKMTLMALFVSLLLLIAANTVYCGPNPGVIGDGHLSGPALIGEITISQHEEYSMVYIEFSGKCKNKSVYFPKEEYLLVGSFEDLIPEYLEGWIFSDRNLDCNIDSYEVIINTIVSFEWVGEEGAEVIKAKAVLLPIIYK